MSEILEGEVVESRAIAVRENQDSAAIALRDATLKQIRKQSKLTWLKRRELIASSVALTEEVVKTVDAIVLSTGIPYHMIAMIPNMKGGTVQPYIMADGWFLKARCDPRGILEIEQDFLVDEENQSCKAWCIITLGTGQKFKGVTFKKLPDEQTRNRAANMSTMVNKCVTQARGKAAYLAVGGTLPGIAEEYQDVYDGESAKAEIVLPKAPKGTPKNTAQLLSKAASELNLDLPKVLGALGVTSLGQIDNFDKAWETLTNFTKTGELK